MVFTKHKFAKLSTTELRSKLETGCTISCWKSLERRNGTGTASHIQRPERVHKGLARLRESKRQCKAARKALHKAGMKGSEEDKLITGLWRRLLKQHNRLRIAVNKQRRGFDRILIGMHSSYSLRTREAQPILFG